MPKPQHAQKEIFYYETEGNGQCFFHAALGILINDVYRANEAVKMRAEWHGFLAQFSSIIDPKMPPLARICTEKMLTIFFNDFIHAPQQFRDNAYIAHLVNETQIRLLDANRHISLLVQELKQKILSEPETAPLLLQSILYEITTNTTRSNTIVRDNIKHHFGLDHNNLSPEDIDIQAILANDKDYLIHQLQVDSTLENSINENIKAYAYLYNREQYSPAQFDQNYCSEQIMAYFLNNPLVYAGYLTCLKENNYYIFLEEIPLLASLSNTKIVLWYKEQEGYIEHIDYLPDPELVAWSRSGQSNYQIQRLANNRGAMQSVEIYHAGFMQNGANVGLHFSRARSEHTAQRVDSEAGNNVTQPIHTKKSDSYVWNASKLLPIIKNLHTKYYTIYVIDECSSIADAHHQFEDHSLIILQTKNFKYILCDSKREYNYNFHFTAKHEEQLNSILAKANSSVLRKLPSNYHLHQEISEQIGSQSDEYKYLLSACDFLQQMQFNFSVHKDSIGHIFTSKNENLSTLLKDIKTLYQLILSKPNASVQQTIERTINHLLIHDNNKLAHDYAYHLNLLRFSNCYLRLQKINSGEFPEIKKIDTIDTLQTTTVLTSSTEKEKHYTVSIDFQLALTNTTPDKPKIEKFYIKSNKTLQLGTCTFSKLQMWLQKQLLTSINTRKVTSDEVTTNAIFNALKTAQLLEAHVFYSVGNINRRRLFFNHQDMGNVPTKENELQLIFKKQYQSQAFWAILSIIETRLDKNFDLKIDEGYRNAASDFIILMLNNNFHFTDESTDYRALLLLYFINENLHAPHLIDPNTLTLPLADFLSDVLEKPSKNKRAREKTINANNTSKTNTTVSCKNTQLETENSPVDNLFLARHNKPAVLDSTHVKKIGHLLRNQSILSEIRRYVIQPTLWSEHARHYDSGKCIRVKAHHKKIKLHAPNAPTRQAEKNTSENSSDVLPRKKARQDRSNLQTNTFFVNSVMQNSEDTGSFKFSKS